MAIPVDLDKLIHDKAARRKLTTPQMLSVIEQVKALYPHIFAPKHAIPASPAELAIQLSGGRWFRAPHLDLLNQKLVSMVKGEIPRMMVSMPPRHGKSELISFWFPLWLLAKNPRRRIVLASYETTFAAYWGARVRNAVVNYPELGMKLGEKEAAEWWNLVTEPGCMISAGAGGPITGKGADILIIDDPIKGDEEANSEVYREKVWNWWQTVAFPRLEPGAIVVIVGTRWHQDDLIGRLELASTSGTGIPWEILKLPALAEEQDPLGRQLGEPLWPERFGKPALDIIQRGQSPYNWSALYQQRPTPEEGAAVKRTWWRFYREPPARFEQLIQAWDLAFKDLKKSDYCVGQVWGRNGAEFYLLYQVRARMDSVEVIEAMRAMQVRFPQATRKLIEDKANGPAVISILQREIPGMVPVNPKGTKSARLEGCIPLIQAGNVYLPENPDGTKARWVWDLVEELAQFPNGTNDDQVDATSMALNFLKPAGWMSFDRQHREAVELGSAITTTQDYLKVVSHRFWQRAIKKADRQHNPDKATRVRTFPGTPRQW